MSFSQDETWAARALCAGQEPDALFVQGAAQRQVRTRCFACPVRLECLADALQSEANYGVWGGLTERERRAMLRHYEDVTDWWQWLNGCRATSTNHPQCFSAGALDASLPLDLSHD